jgi:hypothetical protein
MSDPDPRKEAKARADKREATQARREKHAPKKAAARARRGSDPGKVTRADLDAL